MVTCARCRLQLLTINIYHLLYMLKLLTSTSDTRTSINVQCLNPSPSNMYGWGVWVCVTLWCEIMATRFHFVLCIYKLFTGLCSYFLQILHLWFSYLTYQQQWTPAILSPWYANFYLLMAVKVVTVKVFLCQMTLLKGHNPLKWKIPHPLQFWTTWTVT